MVLTHNSVYLCDLLLAEDSILQRWLIKGSCIYLISSYFVSQSMLDWYTWYLDGVNWVKLVFWLKKWCEFGVKRFDNYAVWLFKYHINNAI